jgi:hypothetical protein
MGEVFRSRDRAYLDLLHRGLVMLRNYSRGDRIDLCRIEAEHLHEIPTLIGEANEHRHTYYLHGTRSLYLQQLRELDDAEYLEQVTIWYAGPWRVQADVAGVDLAE